MQSPLNIGMLIDVSVENLTKAIWSESRHASTSPSSLIYRPEYKSVSWNDAGTSLRLFALRSSMIPFKYNPQAA